MSLDIYYLAYLKLKLTYSHLEAYHIWLLQITDE